MCKEDRRRLKLQQGVAILVTVLQIDFKCNMAVLVQCIPREAKT